MFKKISIVVLVVLAIIIGSVFIFSQGNQSDDSRKIVTNIYPAYELVNSVAGENFNVELINTPGIDPHDFEPTGKQISEIENSEFFVYFDGIGEWEDQIVEQLDEKKTKVLNLSLAVDTIEIEDKDHKEAQEDHKEEVEEHSDEVHSEEKVEEHAHDFDPHIWLDPVRMSELSNIVASELSQIDPDNSSLYKNNAAKFITSLTNLNSEIANDLSSCSLDTIVTSHDAFGYLGQRYGFEIVSISGINPEDEPTSMDLVELIEIVKDKKINNVLFETQVTTEFAELIAKEAGVKTSVIYSLEAPDKDSLEIYKDYIGLMKENGRVLTEALNCGKI